MPRQDTPHVPSFPTLRDPHALLARLGESDGVRRWLETGVVLLLAVQAARLAWLLLPPEGLGTLPAAAGPELALPRLAIDAFHPAPAAAVAADTSGLRLFAVRPAPAGGSAIVATAEGSQRAITVGEAIAPGVVLAEVHADHVVLDSGGRRSGLRFASAGNPAPMRTSPVAAATASAPVPATTPPAAADAPAVDPAQLLAQMGLRPEQTDGRVTGYTVIPRGDAAVLRQAGLQAGDVLLSVNNEALDPERHAALGEILGRAASITLTYRRDGRIHTATLQAPTP